MNSALHHLSKRKRVNKKLEVYPSPRFFIKWLDKLLILIAVIGPLMALPQLFLVYSAKDATGISALSWGSWAFMNIIWLAYGIVHKEKPIIVTYILWFLVNLLMAIAPFIY